MKPWLEPSSPCNPRSGKSDFGARVEGKRGQKHQEKPLKTSACLDISDGRKPMKTTLSGCSSGCIRFQDAY